MPYRILLTQDVKKQIQNLPGNIKAIARQQIAEMAIDPRPPRSKELEGHNGHFRLHIATKYRLVWLILEEDQIVEIEHLGPKSPDLYETLGFARPEQTLPEAE
ncbi:MAG: type II toxin-antitoxin system RelE family toxin [Roseiflexaceae bacterium]